MADVGIGQRLNVGYTRTSTDKQSIEDKAFGVVVQRRAIAAYAELRDVEVHHWVHDSASGATLEREGLSEILSLAEQGRLARLIVARQDRVARDALLAETIYRRVQEHGGQVVNVEIDFGDNKWGVMFRRLLDSFAEIDRLQIIERTNKGRIEGVRKLGTHLFGYSILGYRPIPRDESDHLGLPRGSLLVEEREAETVRLTFAIREMGYSYDAIAAWLNEHGHETRRGRQFASTSVGIILHNEGFYRGERVGVSAEVLGLTEEQYAAITPAHRAILPPREPGVALIVDRELPSLPRGTAVPDDPFGGMEPERTKVTHIHSITKAYALAVAAIRERAAGGQPHNSIANELNEEGMTTRTGGRFYSATVTKVLARMDRLWPLAEEALARPEPDRADVRCDGWDEPARMAQMMAAKGLGRKKGQMTLSQIADTLNAEFGATPWGARFYPATVSRLLERPVVLDSTRTVAYLRFAAEGVDYHGQADAIGEWAKANGLKVDEWYVDVGPAYTKADNPELLRMLADAEAKRFQRAAIFSMERICRAPDVARDVVRRLSKQAEIFFIGDASTTTKRHKKPKKPPFVPGRS